MEDRTKPELVLLVTEEEHTVTGDWIKLCDVHGCYTTGPKPTLAPDISVIEYFGKCKFKYYTYFSTKVTSSY